MSTKHQASLYIVRENESNEKKSNYRKSKLNKNKAGSVRNINGTVYVDFMYLDERVRESSGLPWNEKNAKRVRELVGSDYIGYQFRNIQISRCIS